MATRHEFKLGDQITVYDMHSSVAPFAWPTSYNVIGIDGDYYILRPRGRYTTQTKIVGAYYPHMKLEIK